MFRLCRRYPPRASMRNTNFKKYAGLFRRPPNVANRIRLRRATSNAHVFNKFHTQAYFGDCRMLRTGFVFDEPLRTPTYLTKFHTQAYRSGHNEAVLKTVCLTGTGVRIPQPAPKNTNFSVGVFLFFVLNLCAVTTGEERKTVDNCFSRTKSTKQRKMKQGYALSTFRLCDLTGHVELKTVWV